jgi:sortase A
MWAMRRALHVLSIALITAGVVILVDVGMTLAWKEPVSTLYGTIQQGKAADSLDELEQRFLARPDVKSADRDPADGDADAVDSLSPGESRELAEIFAREVRTGEGIGRIGIPGIGIDTVVVQGTDTATLQKGPGHYPETAFPGEGRTIGIAGHRTTYLAPFRKINEIDNGDEIVLEMPYGTFTYEVQKHEIVDPYQVDIVDDVGYERLVLTACHPLYSAAQRWAVFARLTEARPVSG